MNLNVVAKTDAEDLVIDYIEVELVSGKSVSLNWNKSYATHFACGTEIQLNAVYTGVNFDEEDAIGRLDELIGLKVTDVGLYSEKNKIASISINAMTFSDCNKFLHIKDAYSIEGGDARG